MKHPHLQEAPVRLQTNVQAALASLVQSYTELERENVSIGNIEMTANENATRIANPLLLHNLIVQ